MIRFARGAVVASMVLFAGQAIAGEPDGAEGLIAKLKASLRGIESV